MEKTELLGNKVSLLFSKKRRTAQGLRDNAEPWPGSLSLRDREQEASASYVEASYLAVPDSQEHVFVMTFAPNRGRMMCVKVFHYNSHFQQWQEQSISTESRPTHVYVSKKEMLLVAFRPEQDRDKPENIYTISRYLPAGPGKDSELPYEETQHKKLPSGKGFKIIPVTVHIEMSETDTPRRVDG